MNKNIKFYGNKTKNLVFIAMFAVLIAVCSWISIPTAIPFTMQTFAVYLAFDFLGAKKGVTAVTVYLLLGIIGVPVFSNFTVGIGVLLGEHGGYMLGWLLSGIVMGAVERFSGKKIWTRFISMVLGLLVCYIVGTIWFLIIYTKSANALSIGTAVLWCVVPFVIPDLMKLGLALWISQRLKKTMRYL